MNNYLNEIRLILQPFSFPMFYYYHPVDYYYYEYTLPEPILLERSSASHLEFYYMNGCKFCNEFMETDVWDNLGKFNNLILHKYEYTINANNIPNDVRSFPTFRLYNKNMELLGEHEGIDRTYASIIAWIDLCLK